MTFAARETSRTRGRPINLYLFRYGEAESNIFAYTDAEKAVALAIDGFTDPVTFEPTTIARDEITASGTFDKASIEVTGSQDLEMVDLFRLYPPSHVVTLGIYETHVGETEAIGRWFGRVISFSIEGIEARFVCEPISTSLKRVGLRRHYQLGCPHVLYGAQCRADKPSATTDFPVLAVDGSLVGLGAAWAADAVKVKYHGGIAEWTLTDGRPERRTILRCDSDGTVVLGGYATGLLPGAAISLSLGCNHQMSDCRDLHDNILNFGGQPWIPLKSPTGLVNNFY